MKLVKLYTDGACSGNPGPGGWGCVVKSGHTQTNLSGYGGTPTTNNKMELMAVVEGLVHIQEPSRVQIYSDSTYVVEGINKHIKHWAKKDFKDIKNVILWEFIWRLIQEHKVECYWVKAHNGHYYNEMADKLARDAIPSKSLFNNLG